MGHLATFDLSKRLDFGFRKNMSGSKRLIFKNSDGTAYPINNIDFQFNIRKFNSTSNTLQLTEGSGLTVSGAGNNELTVSLTQGQGTALKAVTYYYSLVNITDVKTWLNGNFTVFDDDTVIDDSNANVTIDLEPDVIEVTVAGVGADATIENEDLTLPLTIDADATIDVIQNDNIELTFATSWHANGKVKLLNIVGDSVNSLSLTAPSGIPVRKLEDSPNFDNSKINHLHLQYLASIGGSPVINYHINHTTQFSAEATAVFALFADSVPTALKTILATFIDSQVQSGNWSLGLDYFTLLGMNTAANSLKDWIHNVAMSAVTSPTYSNTGYTFSGTQHIRSGWIPGTSLLVSQNNWGFGVFSVSNSGGTCAMGALGSGLTGFLGRDPGPGGIRWRIGNATDTVYTADLLMAANTTYGIERTASNAIALRKAGASVQTNTLVSAAAPSIEMFIGGRNNAGSFDSGWAGKIRAAWGYKPTTFNASNFETNLQTMMTALDAYFA